MMKLTLMIEGDAAAIVRVLASIDPDIKTTESPARVEVAPVRPEPSTPTGTGIPVAPATGPSVPTVAAQIPSAPFPITMPPVTSFSTGDNDDDNGPPAADAPFVDKAGMRWDERIHAGNRATKADGTWKRRRGVDDALVAAVEAELRGGAPTPPPAVTAPSTPPVAIPQPMPVPAPVAVPVAPPQPVAVPVAPPQPAAEVDFAEFLKHLGEIGAAGRVDPDYLIDLTTRTATAWQKPLNSITDIGVHPEMIPWVVETMKLDGRW